MKFMTSFSYAVEIYDDFADDSTPYRFLLGSFVKIPCNLFAHRCWRPPRQSFLRPRHRWIFRQNASYNVWTRFCWYTHRHCDQIPCKKEIWMIQTFGKIYIVKIAKKFSFAKNVRGEFHQSSYFFSKFGHFVLWWWWYYFTSLMHSFLKMNVRGKPHLSLENWMSKKHSKSIYKRLCKKIALEKWKPLSDWKIVNVTKVAWLMVTIVPQIMWHYYPSCTPNISNFCLHIYHDIWHMACDKYAWIMCRAGIIKMSIKRSLFYLTFPSSLLFSFPIRFSK